MLLPWSSIETVFLDMDGTILDLHFDNFFWQQYLPEQYAKYNKLSIEQAKTELFSLFNKQAGQLNWYSIEYWTDTLNMPILQLKQEIAHLIGWREQAEYFLQTLRQMNKQVILITNAHPKSLYIKNQKVNMEPWFEQMISSHNYGYPKEHQKFWQKLNEELSFDAKHSLFIDDSLTILESAKTYGIEYLCTIAQPDSTQPALQRQHNFIEIKDFRDCF